jgi:hypothetical protein
MKKIIIILMSLIANVFYAQSTDEVELAKIVNNIVTTSIPNLSGKDYFVLTGKEGYFRVVSKTNDNYTYYNIELGRTDTDVNKVIETKALSYIPIFDKIFTNFVPKSGVKRYLSDYGQNVIKEYIVGRIYFAIYNNGVKTFDTSVLSFYENNKESPIYDEILKFLLVDVLVYPEKLIPSYTNTIKTGTFKRNNCGAGQTGSSVLYTVPAGKYTSTISQADADAQAQADVNANGQNNANNQGTCKKGVVKEVEPEE